MQCGTHDWPFHQFDTLMNALLADSPPRLDFTQFTDVGVNLLRFAQFVVKVRTPAPIRLARHVHHAVPTQVAGPFVAPHSRGTSVDSSRLKVLPEPAEGNAWTYASLSEQTGLLISTLQARARSAATHLVARLTWKTAGPLPPLQAARPGQLGRTGERGVQCPLEPRPSCRSAVPLSGQGLELRSGVSRNRSCSGSAASVA